MSARCRSCKAPIWWVVHEATGKRMPLDLKSDPRGNIIITGEPDPGGTEDITYRVATPDDAGVSDRYISHFATCPTATAWRGKVKRTDPATDEWLRKQEAKQ